MTKKEKILMRKFWINSAGDEIKLIIDTYEWTCSRDIARIKHLINDALRFRAEIDQLSAQ